MTIRNIVMLKQLRRVAENAPEDLLHMRAVVERSGCGTARCLLGWSFVDAWFIENTMFHRFHDHNDQYLPDDLDTPDLAIMFGISKRDAEKLFATDSCPPNMSAHCVSKLPPKAETDRFAVKQEVLNNIDRLLAGKRAVNYKAVRGFI